MQFLEKDPFSHQPAAVSQTESEESVVFANLTLGWS